MSGSTYGTLYKVSTFGESHGGCVGAVVDGCPPGLELLEADIQSELDRRRPGQSDISSPRKETDTIEILSGVFEGRTTGTPILLLARNKDMRSEDYNELKKVLRPSHADFTYEKKYGLRDWRGSGRASARETLARVAAGAIAQKFLRAKCGIEMLSYVEQVYDIKCNRDPLSVQRKEIEANIVRCPDGEAAMEMVSLIQKMSDEGDSVGGVVRGVIKGLPVGIGEPVFDRFAAELGKGMLSINAVKGFDFGRGFECITMKGSEHNDPFIPSDKPGGVGFAKNDAGGTLGGITTGEPVLFRVAFKPVATIRKIQSSVTPSGEARELSGTGRHDPCVLPRAVPIVDAMAAIVVLDLYLRHRGVCEW